MERYLSVEDVARMFPAEKGKIMHANTICTWITRGINGIKLAARKPGKRYFIRPEAVEEFLNAVEASRNGSADTAVASAKRDPKRKATASKNLKRHGVEVK